MSLRFMFAKWRYQHESSTTLSVRADLPEWLLTARATINSLFCVKYLLRSLQSFTFTDTDWKFRQTSETDCLWILNHKFTTALQTHASNSAASDPVALDTSWEAFFFLILLPNPPVNFQYLMSRWAVAASGNPQWCDWWISQYSDLFSGKLTRLACQHGLTDHINP